MRKRCVKPSSLKPDKKIIHGKRCATEENNRRKTRVREGVTAAEADTVRTTLFGHGWPDAPHRTLRTPFVEEWLEQEARGSESRSDEPVVGQTQIAGQTIPVLRFMGFPPNATATEDIESMNLLAGESVGLVHEIKPAALIIRDLIEEARQIIEQRLTPTLLRRQ